MDRSPLGPVLFFDGVCNLCNGSVNFVIDRDPKGIIAFAALQSEAATRLLGEHGVTVGPSDSYASMVLLENGVVYTHSTALLRAAKHLTFPWSLASVFLIVPRFVRDAVYSFVAKRRYAWFGKSEVCRVPTPELKARFLG